MQILFTISLEEAKILKKIAKPGENLDAVAKRLLKRKINKLKISSHLINRLREHSKHI